MKIYATYDEKYVINEVFYNDGSDSYLYHDASCENEVSKEELLKAVERNSFIIEIVGEGEVVNAVVPSDIDFSNTYAAVSYVVSGETALEFEVVYTKEYSA